PEGARAARHRSGGVVTEDPARTSDGEPLLALALGIGGGLILAYVRRHDGPPDGASSREEPPPTPIPPVESEVAGGTGTGACSLRLDGAGLTADGHRVD